MNNWMIQKNERPWTVQKNDLSFSFKTAEETKAWFKTQDDLTENQKERYCHLVDEMETGNADKFPHSGGK